MNHIYRRIWQLASSIVEEVRWSESGTLPDLDFKDLASEVDLTRVSRDGAQCELERRLVLFTKPREHAGNESGAGASVTDLNRYDSVPRAVYVVQRRGDRLREHKTRAGRATLERST